MFEPLSIEKVPSNEQDATKILNNHQTAIDSVTTQTIQLRNKWVIIDTTFLELSI